MVRHHCLSSGHAYREKWLKVSSVVHCLLLLYIQSNPHCTLLTQDQPSAMCMFL